MLPLLWSLISLPLLAADAEKSSTLHYVKPVDDKYVLESEVTTTPNDDGSTFVSRTVRGGETMTLTIRFDKKGQVVTAEAAFEKDKMKKTAALAFRDKENATLKRGGLTDYLKASPDVIVTTAPDWSDVLQLVRRYDAKKAGKQEFTGFWFHPVNAYQSLTFSIEHVGKDKIGVTDKVIDLQRYAINLRSGEYLVWADVDGKVCKILPRKKGTPVVLEGLEELTKDLK